jgi:anti-anti-sigma factor
MIAILNVRETSYAPATGENESSQPQIPVLMVSGRLDASTVSILEHSMLRSLLTGAKVIIIDMGEVTYISSSGLRVLLSTRRQVRERGGDVVLCTLSPNVRDVFDMVGFTVLFRVCGSLDEAKQTGEQINTNTPQA